MNPSATSDLEIRLNRLGLPNGAVAVILLLEVLLATTLSFHLLGEKGLWYDEICSVVIARDWSEMWQVLLNGEANMWLYYTLLNLWMKLGDSEFAVRSLSAIFAICTVPVIYKVGERLWSPRVGLIAAFLLSISSPLIEFAQEARSYSLTLFLTVLASWYFVKAVDSRSSKDWVAYAVIEVLAIYAHFFAALVPLGHIGALILFQRSKAPWKQMVYCAAVAGFLLVPFFLFQPLDSPQIDYLTTPELDDIGRLFAFFTRYRDRLLFVYVAAILLALVSLVRRRPGDPERAWPVLLVTGWLVVPIAVTFVVSVFVQPIFALRYLLICLGPFLLLVAAGLGRIRPRWVLAGTLLLIAAISARGLNRLYEAPKQDWRRAATLVGKQKQPGDGVIFFPYFTSVPFKYYWGRLHGSVDSLNDVEISSGPYNLMPVRVPDPNLERVDSLAGQYDRVWLIRRPVFDGVLGFDEQHRQIEETLLDHYQLGFDQILVDVRVRRYDKIPPTPKA